MVSLCQSYLAPVVVLLYLGILGAAELAMIAPDGSVRTREHLLVQRGRKRKTDSVIEAGVSLLNSSGGGWTGCNVQPLDNTSVWQHFTSHPSCIGQYKTDGSGMCAGDPTSITMDLRQVSDKRGCYVWGSKCTWSMKSISRIEFDAEWADCVNIWFAPLWLTPLKWVPPQGRSGEIDLLETCKAGAHNGKIGTSIICKDHPNSACFEPLWGSAAGSAGPQHFIGQIDAQGTWTLQRCAGGQCNLVSRFPNYLSIAHATSGDRDDPYEFMSDIFNGGAGDAGWNACGSLNLQTQCRFKIANITLVTKPGMSLSPQCNALQGTVALAA